MNENLSIFSFALLNNKPIKKEKFLNTMAEAVPWEKLTNLIEAQVDKKKRGRKHLDTELKLKCLCLQMWYGLSDEGLEDDINDRASFQRFLGLLDEASYSPDATTLCKFREFLHVKNLGDRIFEEINRHIEENGLLIKKGTSVDATIMQAASSTKNKERKRDAEMSSTKKGSNYSFGMKVHTGTDIGTGVVHSLEVSTAKKHDGKIFEELLHQEECYVTGDRAYDSKRNVRLLRRSGIKCGIIKKKPKGKKLRKSLKVKNKINSSLRAWGEFSYNPVKRIWKQGKVRFKGLSKNKSWYYLCFGLSNIYMVRNKLIL